MTFNEPIEFQLQHFLAAAAALRSQLSGAIESASEEAVRGLISELPTVYDIHEKPPLTVAFVGQYNAGKSTLIKALTHRSDIRIDSDVCTDQVTAYDWAGIRLLDTPGVRAGKAEHDSVTEEQITKSDLLIFMITSELFSETTSAYFRDLAFTKHRADELMLVVNKMDQDSGTPEIKRADIEVVTSPRRMLDFQTTFVSAEFLLEASTEEDPEMNALLTERSGIPALIERLNEFVHDRGFIGALTTPLFTMRALANQALTICANDRPEDRIAIEVLGRRARILRDSQNRLDAVVRGLLNQTLTDIAEIGDNAAGIILPGNGQEETKRGLERFQQQAADRVEKSRVDIASAVNAEKDALEVELKRLSESLIVSRLRSALDSFGPYLVGQPIDVEFAGGNLAPEDVRKDIPAHLRRLSSVANTIGEMTIPLAKGARAVSGWGPAVAAGSHAHKFVYAAGKFFNVSFKPWQAAGIASRFAKVGKILGPIGAILQVFGQVAEEQMEAKEQRLLHTARQETRSVYWDSANDVKSQFAAQFKLFSEDFYDSLLSENQELIAKLRDTTVKLNAEGLQFEKLVKALDALIQEIQVKE
ncbi:MAG: GTPase [Verrucomicrobiota bacterium]